MRKMLPLTIAILIWAVNICILNAKTPKEYNDDLIAIQNKVIAGMIEFSKSLQEIDYENSVASFKDIREKHASLIAIAMNGVNEIKKEKPYKKNDKFRKSLENLLKFYHSIVKTDYDEMIKILEKGNDITEKDNARLNEIQKSIEVRETELDRKLQEEQLAFTSSHGIGLKDNDLQDDIDNLGNPRDSKVTDEAINYNDRLISIQSNVLKVFNDLTEATNANNIEDVNKVHRNLLKVTKVSVEQIKKEKPYKGDDSFRNKLKNLLEFYKSISEKEFKEMVLILNKGNSITQSDIDRLSEIQKSIDEREKAFDNDLSKAQSAFAEKFGFKIK